MTQFLASFLGFAFCQLATHPKRRLRKALPRLKIWRLELFPCIRFHGRRRTFHLHHWIYMPIILAVSIPLDNRFLDSHLLRDLLIGGTLQGFFINPKARRVLYQNPLEQSDEYR